MKIDAERRVGMRQERAGANRNFRCRNDPHHRSVVKGQLFRLLSYAP